MIVSLGRLMVAACLQLTLERLLQFTLRFELFFVSELIFLFIYVYPARNQ